MEQSVISILEQLEETAGSNAKKEILQVNRKNDLLRQVFIAAQDPYRVYYVNKFKMPSARAAEAALTDDVMMRSFLIFLDKLSSRQLTGNAAKSAVTELFSCMSELQQKWCQRILMHNLRCGVQETTVNKVWPDSIKSFSVALAHTLKSEFTRGEGIKILDKVNYPVRVEPKLDGLRCVAVKHNGEVTFYTRNGTVLETLPKIKKALEEASYDNLVLDGEAMGDDWNESASVLMSSKSKKDDDNIAYNVFDAVPADDWFAQQSTIPYADRCKLAHEAVLSCVNFDQNEKPRVRLVPRFFANNEDELKTYFAECMNQGYEGVMLKRMDTPYEWDRSKNILKLKPCVTYEGVIVRHYDGRKGTKHEGKFGGFHVVLPNGVVTRVGGGFNDAFRADVQLNGADSYIGKIVEIEAQPDPLTTDGLTKDGKARFPVFTRFRDASDVDPKVVEAGVVWFDSDENIEESD